MSRTFCITVAILLCGVSHACARLVFPPGSDMGYIVSDDPETKFDETNGVNDLDIDEQVAERLLQRGEREAIDVVKTALLKTIEDRSRLQRIENINNYQQERAAAGDATDGKWLGRWFPHPPQFNAQTRHDGAPDDLPENMKDDKHGVAMGIPHVKCDNGKVNLTVDWNESPINYTCFNPKKHHLPVLEDLESRLQCVDIPKNYIPQHYCMNREITYNTTLPVYGPHRPLWPTYGEYVFVPPQRWLHSVEHGAVVLLYHPCAEPVEVQRLRIVLTKCFRKHVITPYTLLTTDRPMALVAWGCSLEMATVNDEEVRSFIKKHALKGPEGHMAKDGSYKKFLINKAEYPPGAKQDKNICPMDQS
ncbi:hypothetical protein SK128_003306 [Halocaridina rubra]|uniref:Uncharacterized protein n=1 Tax=Halocaridina rubra TaxID=373956 RepID=A0AAN8X8L1_HALRR